MKRVKEREREEKKEIDNSNFNRIIFKRTSSIANKIQTLRRIE